MRRRRIRAALLATGLLALSAVAITRPPVLDRLASWADPSLHAEGLAIGWGLGVTARRIALSDAGGRWLILRDPRLAWSPLALLSGRIVVRALTARAVTLARMPTGGGGSGGGPATLWRALPRRLRLDLVAIGRLRLPVGGATETLAVTGRFARVGPHVRGSLVLRDGTARYALRGRWGAAGLDATLRLEEPAGGMIQRLAGLAAAGLPAGGMSVRLRALGPPAAIVLTGEAARAPFSARLAGTLDALTMRGRLDASARLAAPLTLAGARLDAGQLTTRLRGRLAAPSGEIALRLDGLAAGGARAEALRASVRLVAGAVRLRGTLDRLRLPGATAALSGGAVRFRARLSPAPARRLRFRVIQALATVSGAVDPAAQTVRARVRLPDLTPLARLAGLAAGGQAAFRVGA
ncbi:MAG: hypothetical protein ACP5NP_16220, partial [Acetobacteraceae bacterium]